MIFCDGEICGSLDCRDARSMASLVIPSTEDFVTNIHHLKCKVIQLARRQMQKEEPRWSDRMINRGNRVVGAQEKTISQAQKPKIPAQSIAAFAAGGGEVQNLQKIPEREMTEKTEYSSASLNNESTIFHPESNRSNHHPYDSNPEMIQRDRSRDWNPETNRNDENRDWHRETNRNDWSYDRNPENINQNDRINASNEGQNANVQRTEAERPSSNSIIRWTKKILSMNFPIYWIVIVVGILGAASLVCGVLIGAVLCANGNRSFPFFLRMKSRSGRAAY